MNIEIANRLLELRKKNNLSQEELAGKIGISRQAVSKWERAEASPDTDNLIALAKLYDISLDALLLGAEDERDKVDSEDTNAEKEVKAQEADTQEGKSEDSAGNETVSQGDEKTRVHIGRKGIYVKDGKDEVHIGKGGIHINDGDDDVQIDWKDVPKEGHLFRKGKIRMHRDFSWKAALPFPILAFCAFILWGELGPLGWSVSWLWFLTIPLYYSLIDAVRKRKAQIFAYPVLAVLIFFILGFTLKDGWKIGWLMFLTIPLYHTLIGAIRRRKAMIFAYPVLVVLLYLGIGLIFSYWYLTWLMFLTIPIYYTMAVNLSRRSRNRE